MNYIYLKSSDSLEVFPSNVLSDFNIKLPETLDLEGDWEAALLEIQYPNSWPKHHYNLKVFSHIGCIWFDETERNEEVYFSLKINSRSTIDSLIKDFNKQSPFITVSREDDKNGGKLVLTKNSDTDICAYLNKNSQGALDTFTKTTSLYFVMSEELSQIFGFVEKYNQDHVTELKANVAPFIPIYPSAIYVLCDLVETQLTGESYQPILRVIPVPHYPVKDTKTVLGKDIIYSQIYSNPYFKRLKRTSFSTIRIRLTDEYNKPIKFEGGVVVVVLGFRK